MRAVTLIVSSREETNQRFLQAFEGKPQGTFISFESPALLFKVLTGKRWELLKLMTGAGPMSIRRTGNPAFCAGRRHQILFLFAITFGNPYRSRIGITRTHASIT
jgi:predicted transcriptional regulator